MGKAMIKIVVEAPIIPDHLSVRTTTNKFKILPWHWRYFLRLSKPTYPGAPMIKTRKNRWTSRDKAAGWPNASNTGSINAHNRETGIRRIHRMITHRWKWTDRSVFRLPPVKDWDPRVSSAVVPPSATHHPKKQVVGSSSWQSKIR